MPRSRYGKSFQKSFMLTKSFMLREWHDLKAGHDSVQDLSSVISRRHKQHEKAADEQRANGTGRRPVQVANEIFPFLHLHVASAIDLGRLKDAVGERAVVLRAVRFAALLMGSRNRVVVHQEFAGRHKTRTYAVTSGRRHVGTTQPPPPGSARQWR